MIHTSRKNQICKLAENIAIEFSDKNITLLEEIARFESLLIHYDDYEDAFDGMLLYDTDIESFHIHINTNTKNPKYSKRSRFTLAHELAHFFIDEHRLGIKYGYLDPHASFHNINHKSLIELEADYFASCLLMPKNKLNASSKKYKQETGNKKFSFDTILWLSNSFQTSVLSTLIKFAEYGTHEIFVVVSKNNIAKWFIKSTDFPNWKFKFKIGDTIPNTTVAGEYYLMQDRKYTGIEALSVSDWFIPYDNNNKTNRQMYEQCYYSDSYGYVISLIWFD
jgi:Zn-dependent peptidase ImmA (M78 family)